MLGRGAKKTRQSWKTDLVFTDNRYLRSIGRMSSEVHARSSRASPFHCDDSGAALEVNLTARTTFSAREFRARWAFPAAGKVSQNRTFWLSCPEPALA